MTNTTKRCSFLSVKVLIHPGWRRINNIFENNQGQLDLGFHRTWFFNPAPDDLDCFLKMSLFLL